MKRLNLLKWTEGGTEKRLYLMREMSPQWKNIGSLIGFTKAQLDVWKMQNPNDPED